MRFVPLVGYETKPFDPSTAVWVEVTKDSPPVIVGKGLRAC